MHRIRGFIVRAIQAVVAVIILPANLRAQPLRAGGARLRLMVVAVAVALTALANPVEASRGQGPPPPGWTVTPPSTTLVPNGQLQGVSCVGQFCMTVGSFFDEFGGRAPMAESVTADGWSVHPVALPGDALEGHLSAVSCPSTDVCVAVGYMVVGQEERPLAHRWDGRQWAVSPTPSLTGRFFGVSCPSTNRCIAVGAAADSALAAHWDGTAWTARPVPTPTASTSSLRSVSCTAQSACIAVGETRSTYEGGRGPLAERWDGQRWTQLAMPGVAGGELNGVSCTAATACTAVGMANSGGPTGGTPGWLGVGWDGTAWTVQPTGATPDAMLANLTGVSCATSTTCRAVGYYLPTSGPAPILTIAAHWNGSSWSTKTTPNPPDTLNALLLGVSCSGAANCLAVGDWAPIRPGSVRGAAKRTLAERWTTSWVVEPSPNPLGTVEAGLNDVSCPTTGPCHAVGHYADGDGYHRPQAQAWNGQTWTYHPVPAPADSPNAQLQAVSCPTDRNCVAIGHSYHPDSGWSGFAAHWDGTRWSTRPLPRPPGATDVQLADIACPTPSTCVAVGRWSANGSNPMALIQRWDGSRWLTDPATIPPSWYGSWLTGVACATATACVAVGGGHNSTDNDAFALRNTGGGWIFDAIPTSLYRPVLKAVSCPTATDCTAVGHHSPGTGFWSSLAVRWDGSRWAEQPIAKADREQDHQLAAVACTTVTCTAVGQYSDTAGSTHSLAAATADRTSWSTTFAPTDTVPRRDWLTSMSCSTACVAVGRHNGANYTIVTGALPTIPGGMPSPPPSPGPATPGSPTLNTTTSRAASSAGYWALSGDGRVYNFGTAPALGHTAAGAVDLEPTSTGRGYWTLNKNGNVQPFGDAGKFGDVEVAKLAKGEEPTSLSATPSGKGYWVFTNRGRAIAFGDAPFLGDVSDVKLNGPVLGSVATPSGKGYYMVASDGGIFAFGDAKFGGSMGGKKLNAPVQSLVPDSDGKGYWLVASDGGIFAFDAPFRGSLGGVKLNKPVVGMVRYGDGYLMVGADGGIFNFSTLPFSGSLGDKPPASPVVAVAALPV